MHCYSDILTSMGRWKLWFALLLQLTVYVNSKVTAQLVKTIGSKPDVTPICTNATLSTIVLIVCQISTESGEGCSLRYRYGEDFVHECDPRFTLIVVNQTVFLHLTSLTPVDSGNYSCECSHIDGTYILHLNITVEADEDATSTATETSLLPLVTGVFILIVITGVFLGFICRNNHHRRRSQPLTSHANTEPEDIEPYSSYIQRENQLYSTSPNITHVTDTFVEF